jgi:predicted secreted protein
LQFHPEVTPEIMADWVRVYRHELDAEGMDPDAILADTAANAERNTAAAWQLLDRFFDDVARLPEEVARP